MIWLIPIEDRKTRVDRSLLDELCDALKETFHQECIIQHPMKPPAFGRVAGSKRYIGARLLEALPIRNDTLILGITNLDLSMIGYDFTTGLSDLPNHRAIIGLSQLQSLQNNASTDAEQFTDRVVKRAIHELGHTVGLSHCDDPKCVMTFSDAVEEIDQKSRFFCEACRMDLDGRFTVESNQFQEPS